MHISGTKPSSAILAKQNSLKMWNVMPQKCPNKLKPKWTLLKLNLGYFNNFYIIHLHLSYGTVRFGSLAILVMSVGDYCIPEPNTRA